MTRVGIRSGKEYTMNTNCTETAMVLAVLSPFSFKVVHLNKNIRLIFPLIDTSIC